MRSAEHFDTNSTNSNISGGKSAVAVAKIVASRYERRFYGITNPLMNPSLAVSKGNLPRPT